MNIIFFGTASFATTPLLSLVKSEHKLLAVVTQPDKRSGRGLVRSFSPVKLIAQKCNLTIYQPGSVNNREFIKTLKELKPDLFVVAAFGQILSKEVLEVPKLYSINIHASLLPKYRGAAPVNWAILNGEKTTGITIFRMTKGMDEGDIIAKSEINIENEDSLLSLSDKLSKLGAGLLIEALDSIRNGKTEFIPQEGIEATYAPKLKKKDGLIDWKKTGKEIDNHVRGMVPWPAAYTHINGKAVKVWKTKMLDAGGMEGEPGTVVRVDKEGILVKTGDGAILIYEVQGQGGKKMSADAYCRGHRLEVGQKFS